MELEALLGAFDGLSYDLSADQIRRRLYTALEADTGVPSSALARVTIDVRCDEKGRRHVVLNRDELWLLVPDANSIPVEMVMCP